MFHYTISKTATSPLGRLIKWLVPKWQSTEAGQINMGSKVTFTLLLWVSRAPLGHGPIRAWMVGKSLGNYLSFSHTHITSISVFFRLLLHRPFSISLSLAERDCEHVILGTSQVDVLGMHVFFILLRTIAGHRLSWLKTSPSILVPFHLLLNTVIVVTEYCSNPQIFIINSKSTIWI